jgi:pantetheine-phosphate adenylyltransferase
MIGIYPGTFDPITKGHVDIIDRARRIVDTLVVAVTNNPQKVCTFDADTRISMIRDSIGDLPDVQVISFTGLTVDAARKAGANLVVRGLRAISDYELEVRMAIVNRRLNPDIDTVFLVASVEYSFISSSLIKEIARFGGDISQFVPDPVLKYLKENNPLNREQT